MTPREPMTRTYRVAMTACSPIVRRWGRLRVTGLETLPPSGPLLLAGNHDSYWDPVAVGVAALQRRQVRALAKSELWKLHGLNWILDGMGQIPLNRGAGDVHAFDRAVEELRAGACIGIFPEGTRSRGTQLRARSGFGRLAELVPEAEVASVAILGTTDIPRFPTRPSVEVRFFRPAGGPMQPGEDAASFSARLVTEIREQAPISACGRRPKPAPAAA